jgi:enamine deaminase RidA (YjgF/YER057c/UK114 family)
MGFHRMTSIDQRLAELGLKLPEAPQPVANYVPFLISGDQLFISGQIAKDATGRVLTGLLGDSVTVELGQEAARHSALNLLAQAKAALGDLNRIAQVLRLTGFVASTAAFTDQPKVINGASDLLVSILGDAGRHTRSAVGVASLPLNACVEIDAIIKVR